MRAAGRGVARARRSRRRGRSAREPRSPGAQEAFFGSVAAVAPSRRDPGRALRRRSPRRARPRSRGAACRCACRTRPAAYDLRLRFERDGRLLRRDEARGAWLLPASGQASGGSGAATRGSRAGSRCSAARTRAGPRSGRTTCAPGATAGWNADASFPAASTVKLGVLVAALAGTGRGPSARRRGRSSATSPTWSSNEAANRLLVLLGGSEAGGTAVVNGTLQRLGATSSWFTGQLPDRDGANAAARRRAEAAARPHLPADDGARPRPHPRRAPRRRRRQRALGPAHGTRPARGPRRARAAALRRRGREHRPPAPLDRVPLARKEGWTTKVRHTAAIAYAAGRPADRRGADVPAGRGAARLRPVRLGGT